MKIVKIIFLILILVSCRKINNEGYRTYTIKKGKHRSTYSYNTSRDTVFTWKIIFDSSAIYTTQDSANQYDINKLIGWSDCGENHMDYSIRFGWRWLNDSLEIHWFRHQHGQFEFNKIKSINLNKSYTYYMSLEKTKYRLCIDETCIDLDRTCSLEYKKYKLYPYFGGQEPAPHDIKIKIK
tara:strand:+ start:971 stop:1513 length:543 start_codon:yes stop_codon:yes gene_type:complete